MADELRPDQKAQKRYRERNRERCNESTRRSRAKYPETTIRHHLWSHYRITLEQYQEMVERQQGLCAICAGPPNGKVKKLVVDHNHETNTLRALLCDACNRALGYMKESPERLRAAAEYIEGFKESK